MGGNTQVGRNKRGDRASSREISIFSNFRSVERNRTRAFEKLQEALDQFLNQDQSVAAQVKRVEKFRKERTDAKRKKKREERLAADLDLDAVEVAGKERDLNKNPSSDEKCEIKLEQGSLPVGANKATNADKE